METIGYCDKVVTVTDVVALDFLVSFGECTDGYEYAAYVKQGNLVSISYISQNLVCMTVFTNFRLQYPEE